MHILVVLPYSGPGFGGGLAVLNAKLVSALVEEGHYVKLLTMPFSHKGNCPKPQEHGNAPILYIPNKETEGMGEEVAGPKGEKDRNRLYELINDPQVLLQDPVIEAIRKDNFQPELIIGHSRFSGPAAILLKEQVFRDACVQYFLHSIPVEGSALVGYEAYEMKIDAKLAAEKFAKEKEWMPRADIVVAMGPLIRAGAVMILGEVRAKTRVHEVIPGLTLSAKKTVEYVDDNHTPNLLLCGRASAPIKGLEDLLLAVQQCYQSGVKVLVDVLWWEDMNYINMSKDRTKAEMRVMDEEQWAPPIQESDLQPGPNKTILSKTRQVTLKHAQEWIDGLLGGRIVTLKGKANGPEVEEAYRKHDAVLMPSYIEHFGLVPFEALGHGVPVLVNQISGSGMVLADTNRCGLHGVRCVVRDFKGSTDNPRSYLVDVPEDAFDKRPEAWAQAIMELVKELPTRFVGARTLRSSLSTYTYNDFARSVVAVVNPKFQKCAFTYQGPEGSVVVP